MRRFEMNMVLIEPRKHERIFRSDRVVFSVVPGVACPDDLRKESSGRTGDLSEGGACIVTDVPVPVKAVLNVRITIIQPPTIFSHKAIVRWCRQSEADQIWRAGVEFVFAPPHGDTEWKNLIHKLRETSQALASSAA